MQPEKRLKIVDIGCAHAKSFELLNNKFDITYVGIELDSNFSADAQKRYGEMHNFRVINDSITNHYNELNESDVIMAMETLEHIPEHSVVRIIENIAMARPKVFICSVPNKVGPIVFIKNIGSLMMGYVRHKEYTWKETFFASFYNLNKIKHTKDHKGFDWRWLAHTIRHNMTIHEQFSSPFRYLPKMFSTSIIFICFRE